MDIKVLREFIDLSYTLSFSKTAERVFVSQSSLSKHISQLEEELGVQLFIRSRQSVRLTTTGQILRDKFRIVMDAYDDALGSIIQNMNGIHGVLRIGYLDSAVRTLLSNTINIFSKKYPQMTINLASFEVGELSDALKQDAIDIALCISFPNSTIPANTYFRPLYDDGISAVVSSNNPLAQKKEVLFSELLKYPMILPSPIQYPFYASTIREMIEAMSVKANIICDFSNISTALIMVESDMGVSILPTNISNQNSSNVFIPIKDFNPVLQVGAMWKKFNTTIGITEFINEITKLATDMYY